MAVHRHHRGRNLDQAWLASRRPLHHYLTGNRGENGGGIAIATDVASEFTADGQIWNCSILDNVATDSGAGIFALGNATYTIVNTEIAENSATFNESGASFLGRGGGLFEIVTADDNPRVIANCTIVRNLGGNGSQGIYQANVIVTPSGPIFPYREDLTVTNSIVRNNYSGWADAEGTVPAECEEPCAQPEIFGEARVINCLVAFDEQNPPTNFTEFTNCINAPPVLAGIDVGDYRLAEGSPCIDAGDDDLLVFLVDTFDVNDNANDDEIAPDRRLRKRVQPAPGQTVARVDIGAHEYPNCICSTGDFNEDNSVNGSDLGVLLGSWGPCSAPCPADLDGNGEVDGADLGILLGAWCGDREYPRDCVEESSFMSGGSANAQSSEDQSSGLSIDQLAAWLGFADRISFVGWLGQRPFEEMETWLSFLAE